LLIDGDEAQWYTHWAGDIVPLFARTLCYTVRHINKYSPNKEVSEKAVRKALQLVSLQSSRRFLRKANDYKRAYRTLMEGGGADEVAAYAAVDKLRKESKAHRSTFDQDYKFIVHELAAVAVCVL